MYKSLSLSSFSGALLDPLLLGVPRGLGESWLQKRQEGVTQKKKIMPFLFSALFCIFCVYLFIYSSFIICVNISLSRADMRKQQEKFLIFLYITIFSHFSFTFSINIHFLFYIVSLTFVYSCIPFYLFIFLIISIYYRL